MKKVIVLLLALSLVLCGCQSGGTRKYTATYLELFDTVTTVVWMGQSEAEFEGLSCFVYDELERYHQLFDIYHEYEGMNNLCTVNTNAGVAPVQVDSAVIELLKDCVTYYALTGGRVNVAMGGVLKLWHEAREKEVLPAQDALLAAAEHCSIEAVVIDEENSTVFISDRLVQLDVGAIAKGWATQRVANDVPENLLISVGGNVCTTGPKEMPDTPWVVGVQDPDGGTDYACVLQLTVGSAVTSGDYQRCFTVNGQRYHHIIDPQTLQPGRYWRSVTVVCPDSGLADALSTALFLMPLEEGQALAEACGAQAVWCDEQGQLCYSDGMAAYLRG